MTTDRMPPRRDSGNTRRSYLSGSPFTTGGGTAGLTFRTPIPYEGFSPTR